MAPRSHHAASRRAVAAAAVVLAVLVAAGPGSDPGDPPGQLRLPGTDPAELSALVAHHSHPGRADTIVVARSDAYPDALAGAPLAAALDAPILLTASEVLDRVVQTEVVRLRPARAVVLGGPSAVGDGVLARLRSLGVDDVRRIAGPERFTTAALVAKEVHRLTGNRDAFLVEGAHADPGRGWPDAIAVSAAAASEGAPILLTVRDALPSPTRDHLRSRPIEVITAIGGDVAISQGVLRQAAGFARDVRRIAGVGRYDTSAAVADRSVRLGADPSLVWLASGRSFQGALVAAPAAAAEGAPLLLVDPDDPFRSGVSRAWIERHLPAHPRTVGRVDLHDVPPPANGDRVRRAAATFAVQSPEQRWSQHLTGTVDRFEVRLGDRWRNDAARLVNRSELNALEPVPYDTDVWLSFWMRVSGQVPPSWTVVGQFHASGDPLDVSAPPVWAQQLNGDRFRVLVRGSAADPLLVAPAATAVYDDPSFAQGVWHRFVYRLRFSRGGDGLVQGWMDGSEIVPETTVPMGYDDAVGPRLKYGIYRREAPETTVVEFGVVRLSTTPPAW